jgi:hypothetical protein
MDWYKVRREALQLLKVAAIGIWEGLKIAFPYIQSAFGSLGKDKSRMSKEEKDNIATGWFLFFIPVAAPLFFYLLYKFVMWL